MMVVYVYIRPVMTYSDSALQLALWTLLAGRKRVLQTLAGDSDRQDGPDLASRIGTGLQASHEEPDLARPAWLGRAGRHLEDQLDCLAAACSRQRAQLVPYFDAVYPSWLSQIPDPPVVLYVRGDPAALRHSSVAVVGARRCSRAGAGIAQSISARLALLGLSVVSGLAYGIDAAAHQGALQTGATVAVLGGGFEHLQPISNRPLARRIVDSGGCLVSEYAPPAQATKWQFPERNRLISGLSLGVLVVEAGERSGSLITARLALEQGREVMAVPGGVGSGRSRGCHRLLRQGAALVEDAGDVVDALGFDLATLTHADRRGRSDARQNHERESALVPTTAVLGSRQRQVLASMADDPQSVDEILAANRLPADELMACLVDLELEGFVQRTAAGYSRRPFANEWKE